MLGAAPRRAVIRENSDPGDIIVLLGGRTGRDGCGGATGSSKVHTEESIETCGAEVQKGNPPTERKIQRLFRREEVSKLIKSVTTLVRAVFLLRLESLQTDFVWIWIKYRKICRSGWNRDCYFRISGANGGSRRSERCGRIHVLCKGRKLRSSRSCSSDRISETWFWCGEEMKLSIFPERSLTPMEHIRRQQ